MNWHKYWLKSEDTVPRTNSITKELTSLRAEAKQSCPVLPEARQFLDKSYILWFSLLGVQIR
ncbi:MAG TPA: hypothetical protein PK566_17395 [Pseudobacteroides sp.]|nr:hypothetical protein [Pseudobacteroides sp.]